MIESQVNNCYNAIMIPTFPKFEKLSLAHKKDIEKIVKQHLPYSDYNFVSLFSYNTLEKNEVSMLNGNLVVKFHDYITLDPFYSFLGKNNVKKTIEKLLKHAAKEGLKKELKLIPESVVSSQEELHRSYTIKEDPDNFDYILSVEEMSTLKGNKHGAKRNFVNRFLKNYSSHTIMHLNLKDKKTQEEIEKLFLQWGKMQTRTREEITVELEAIRRLFRHLAHFPLITVGVYVDKKLIAFSINEVVHQKHGVIHFEKADISYVGAFQYLKRETATYLKEKGCEFINYEQDLGIIGLRKAKQSWHPITYLKKYAITKK